jgi:hypothetical protein
MRILNLFFLAILWSTLLKPIYDFPDFIYHINIAIIHQAFSIGFVFFGLILATFRFTVTREYGLFILFILAYLIAITGSDFDGVKFSIFLSHSYYIIMPMVCINAGSLLFNRYGDNIIKQIRRVASKCLPILVLLTCCYFFLHFIFGVWDYFGYTSGFVSAYLLTDRYQLSRVNWKLFFLDLFTGKRSSLVLWIFLAARRYYFWSVIVGILLYFFYGIVIDLLPERYGIVFDFDFNNPVLMSLATGGRSNEWLSVIDFLNSSSYGWLFGTGFGMSYDLYDPISDFWEVRHYSHMTPLTYTYLFGLPMAILIYLYLILKSFILERVSITGMETFFFLYLVLSPLGGSLLVEPLPWVLLGICSAAYRNRRTNSHRAPISFDRVSQENFHFR